MPTEASILPIPTSAGDMCGFTLVGVFCTDSSIRFDDPRRSDCRVLDACSAVEEFCGEVGRDRYGDLDGSGRSPKMISWHRCKTR